MSELHRGWSRTMFERIFDRLQYGLTAKADQASTGVRFLRITDLDDGKVDWSGVPGFHADDDVERYVLHDGDFVFARSGSIEKAARIVDPPPSVFASYLIRGRLQNPEIADWLAYFIRSPNYLDQIRERAAGIGMSNVNASKLGSVEVPLPPIHEQRQIVAKLDSLTGRTARAREQLGRIPRLIQKYRESLIASALSGAWAGDGAKGGWTDCKAKELFTWSSGKFLPKSKQASGRTPVYGGNGINGTHDRALVDRPTIVVGRVGAQCGNVYLTDGPAWITDNAIFAQTISERVDPGFALLVLRHSNLNAESGGTGQPYVNQDTLNDVEFSLPSLQEQHEIVRRIETAFAWLDRVTAERANASRLLPKLDQAILAKAFRGELVLLDRR